MQHSNPFLHPGRGVALRRATGATGNTLTSPETTTIPAGGYTEVVGGADCLEMMFEAVFAAAATGDVVVRELTTPGAAAGETFSTDTLAGELIWRFNAGEPLSGFFQVYNNTDQAATIYVQKRIQ